MLPEKKLVGKRLKMTLSNNRTVELWRSFMPKRKNISLMRSSDLFSMQVYNKLLDFNDFDQDTEFEKWAAVEVADYHDVPEDLETYTLTGGLYAVFIHKGAARVFKNTFEFIFNSWLPRSSYALDKREHFELLGERYKNDDPASEEEVWIPIRMKT